MTREEAIAYFKDMNECTYGDVEPIQMAIKALEQESKTGHWIPCSEKLPEIPFGCFVTVEEDDRNGEPQNVLYSESVGYDGETWNRAGGEPIPFEVVAWMPLPEEYKA